MFREQIDRLGCFKAGYFADFATRRGISVGRDSGFSGTVICAAIEVVIGSECLFGANVTIVDTDFHSIKPQNRRYNNNPADIAAAPVFIADNVFVGAGAMILKGVSIGRNSVVGAGAVVTKDVPENVVVAGNPARIISNLGETT